MKLDSTAAAYGLIQVVFADVTQRLAAADDLRLIREACQELERLSVWRNERIHARVRQVDDGLALYESRTRKRLSISHTECDLILQNLTMVIFTLETYLTGLIRSLDLNRELDDFFEEHFKEIEEG